MQLDKCNFFIFIEGKSKMKKLLKKDLSEDISDKIVLNRKTADDVMDLIILEIRDLFAEKNYKVVMGKKPRVKKSSRKLKKIEIPVIENNEDDLIGTIAFGTRLDKKEARKAIKIISNNILDATEENEEVEVEEVGLFRKVYPREGIPQIILKPYEPEIILFPELDSPEKT